jgi:amidohydrolase/hippurate hydrolase
MISEILRESFAVKDYIVRVKRRIHSQPELGMKEFATTAFILSELKSMGVETVPLASDVGVLGIIHGEKAGLGAVSALRADIDALPIAETVDIPDRSTVPGVMHACGHDCHTAMLLGAAKTLVSMKERFSGVVKLIFQPAEETLDGSAHMIRLGVLKNPDVQYILGIHGHSLFDVGQVAIREGSYMASSDFFTVRMTGISGHGAYPHRVGCDAILAASNAIMAIQSIITRQIDALDNVVISVCQISGGSARNVIPETVEFSGSVRCQRAETRKTIEERIRRTAESVALAYGCKATLDYHYGIPPLVNSPALTARVRQSAQKIVGVENVKEIGIPAMGSEDFSRYTEIVPQCVFARLGIRDPGRPEPMFHNGSFFFPEDALPYGTALLTQFVLDVNA